LANLWNWNLNRCETLLAVSGGADSVAMAHFFKQLNYPFAMAHVNYGLRGEESEKDQHLVQTLAKELGVDCFIHRANALEISRIQGTSVQMSARQIRYEFFNEIRELHPGRFAKIATAHHGSDNLEHFFIYLIRGNTAVAWRGIPVENGDIIRPMLGYSKNEIYTIASENGWSWREDASNQKPVYLRNRIRNWILPLLSQTENAVGDPLLMDEIDLIRDFYRLSVQNQRLNRERLPQWEHQWESWVERTEHSIWIPQWSPIELELQGDPSFYAFVVGRLMNFGFSKDQANKILSFNVSVGGKLTSQKFTAWRARNGWMLWEQTPIAALGTLQISSQKTNEVLDFLSTQDNQSIPHVLFLNSNIEGMKLKVGLRERGQFFIKKSGKRELLSDVFTDLKIENYMKDAYPVISNESGEVIAVLGLKTSEIHRMNPEDSHCFRVDFIQN